MIQELDEESFKNILVEFSNSQNELIKTLDEHTNILTNIVKILTSPSASPSTRDYLLCVVTKVESIEKHFGLIPVPKP